MRHFLFLFIFTCTIICISAQDKNTLAKSDSLFAKGVELYNQKKYAEAIPLFSESDWIDKAELDSSSNRRDYSAMWLSSCYFNLGDIETAKTIYPDYKIKPVDRRLTVKSDSLSQIATQIYEQNPLKAVSLLNETAQIEKTVIGENHPYYYNTLFFLASVLTTCGMSEKSIDILDECLEIMKSCYGEKSLEYANVLSSKGFVYHLIGTSDAILHAVDARESAFNIFNECKANDKLQLESYYLASDYLSLGDLANDDEQSILFYKKGLEVLPFSGGIEDSEVLDALFHGNIGMKYLNIDIEKDLSRKNPNESIRMITEAISNLEAAIAGGFSSRKLSLSVAYTRLGNAYQGIGEPLKAINSMERSLSIIETIPDVDIKFVSYPLLNLVTMYRSNFQLLKSYELLKSAQSLLKDTDITKEVLQLNINGAYNCIDLGKFIEAKKYIERATKIADKLYDGNAPEYVEFLATRSGLYQELNDEVACLNDLNRLKDLTATLYPNDSRAMVDYLKREFLAKISFGDSSWETVYLNLITKLQALDNPNPKNIISVYASAARAYAGISKYDKAKELIDDAIRRYTPISSNDPSYLLTLKHDKLDILISAYDMSEAFMLCEEILASPDLDIFYEEQVYRALSTLLYDQGDIDGAIEKMQKAIDCRTNLSGADNLSVIQTYLATQAKYYEMKDDFTKSAELRRQVINLASEYLGEDSEFYLRAIVELESIPTIGNGNRRKDAQLRLLENVKVNHGEKSLSYYNCLMETAETYLSLGLYEEGVRLGEEAVGGMTNILGAQNEKVQAKMLTLAQLYFNTGDYEKAMIECTRSYELTQKYHPNGINRLYNASAWKIRVYQEQLDFGSMRYQTDKLIQQAQADFGENSYEHFLALKYKIEALLRIGDYSSLETLSKEIVSRSKQYLNGRQKKEIVSEGKNNLMLAFSGLGKYDAAIALGNELLQEAEEGDDSSGILHNLAITYYWADHKDKALETSYKVPLHLTKQMDGHKDLASAYVKQGYIRSLCGNYNEGIKLMERGLALRDSLYKGEGFYYASGLYDMVKVHDVVNNTEERNNYAVRLSYVARDYLLKSFLTLPANSRQALWNQYSNFFLNEFPSFTAAAKSEEMNCMAYNNVLFGKGLLLSTDRSISDYISKSSNADLQKKYTEYKRNIKLLDYIQTADPSKIVVNVDSVKRLTRELEFEIINGCGNFTSNLNTHWEDIRASLKRNEVAVEFCMMDNISNNILALIVKHDSPAPRILVLEGIDARSLWDKNPQKFSNLLWKPLSDVIGNVETIYFSPSGTLHNIPIESLPDFEYTDSLISARWHLHRLTSTKMLTQKENNGDIKSPALYGGLTYDAGVDILADDAVKYPSIGVRYISLYNDSDSLGIRGGVRNLPQTKVEIDNISNILKQQNLQPSVFTDVAGTEASFKNLSGQSTDLLHIATHGFYWTEREARRIEALRFLKNNDDISVSYAEDKAMTRSGLLFTGANNALMGIDVPDNTEDGVLTAKEIANLDFNNLDMAVLSACQTGLGEITGEGVFGLQRGFKKAGAKTLLMSLWKVDDHATQMLMTQFYEHFLSGKSKHESLLLAQKYVREYEEEVEVSGDSEMTASQKRKRQKSEGLEDDEIIRIKPYADPKYWAAFILLDALN